MTRPIPGSEREFAAAEEILPGGVNSPVRAYRGVGGTPVFLAEADGCRVVDVDGNEYVDLVLAYGPHILGHRHPAILGALRSALERGTAFGAPTAAETLLARKIRERMPWVEMLRLVNSGTEATMSALRLARAFTGRSRVLKFEGCYHGHGDAFLVKAGSGALTLGEPDSAGVPPEVASATLVAPYNDLDATARAMEGAAGGVAAVIVEPVAGNFGCVLPAPGFLAGLRELCDRHGALLVFDEVMTGFRVGPGGYAGLSGVHPDLVCLGKVIGGGLPVGAYGGRREILRMVAPLGPMYQAGTLSGNPLAVAAGLAALEELGRPGVYDALEDKGAHLAAGLEHICRSLGIRACVPRQGSMLALHFGPTEVRSLAAVLSADRARFARFFHRMREAGVLLPPSPFESWFLSTAHDVDSLDHVLDAARTALQAE
jgi:glutamate-1-semialdehyde 2,1-aminomutase